MKRWRVAIVGHGKLGSACAAAMRDCAELKLAGSVRRGGHVRELLQQGFAVVECAAHPAARARRPSLPSLDLGGMADRLRESDELAF